MPTARRRSGGSPRRDARRARAAACAPVLLALAAGCDDTPPRPAAPPRTTASAPAAPALPRYFPLAPGDRWRTRGGSDGTVPRAFGVTGVDARGVAIVFGGAGDTPERYTADARAVTRVDEQGRPLVPLLRVPLEEGASWSYTLAERGVSVPCNAEVVRRDTAPREVAGARLAACVTVRRVCRYPAGAPFPLATTHDREETYCPDVGLVGETQRFSPPPAPGLLPAVLRERLVAWRVRGAPPSQAEGRLTCDDVLLLPSDVQAACGAALQPAGERTGADEEGACVFRYGGGGRTVDVRVRDARETHDEPAPRDGTVPGIALRTPHAAVDVAGCDDPRLTALLRSLLP